MARLTDINVASAQNTKPFAVIAVATIVNPGTIGGGDRKRHVGGQRRPRLSSLNFHSFFLFSFVKTSTFLINVMQSLQFHLYSSSFSIITINLTASYFFR